MMAWTPSDGIEGWLSIVERKKTIGPANHGDLACKQGAGSRYG